MPGFPETIAAPGWGDLAADPALAYVLLAAPVDLATVGETLAGAGLVLVTTASAPGWQVGNTPTRLWVTTAGGGALPAGLAAVLAGVGLSVDRVAPAYDTGRGAPNTRIAPLPHRLLVSAAGSLADVVGSLGLRLDEERSRYLGPYAYVEVGPDAVAWDALAALRERLPDADVRLDFALLEHALAGVPDDPLFGSQWNMTQVHAPEAWDVAQGSPLVLVAICEAEGVGPHPDLVLAAPPFDPLSGATPSPNSHPTSCAGIATAVANNGVGVAGIASGCRILSAGGEWTDASLGAGVRWATAQGAAVVNLSYATLSGPDAAQRAPLLEAAMQDAVAHGVVVCAAAGNRDLAEMFYPGSSTAAIGVGGSDKQDARVTKYSHPTYPGSNYGPELSVVAPSLDCMTTSWGASGATYEPFLATSCATPHVAGLAALLRSAYPSLTSPEIRAVIERTAVKPAALAFADDPAYPHGSRNAEVGYGRIDAYRAVDFADVMIRDYPDDSGAEPSTPPNGVFWETCDIAVQPALVPLVAFDPSPAAASRVVRGADNRVYVRVRNNGPAVARNVSVDVRVVAFAGTGFVYPGDWTATDATHLAPARETLRVASLGVGQEMFATFLLTAAQVAEIDAWSGGMHPCVLAVVSADNDYAFATAAEPVALRRNNIAQRNVTVVDLLSLGSQPLPLMVGSAFGEAGRTHLVVDRSDLPAGAGVFVDVPDEAEGVRLHGADGGHFVARDLARSFAVREPTATLRVDLARGVAAAMRAHVRLPDGVTYDRPVALRLSQQDENGAVVGGITVLGLPDPPPAPDLSEVRQAFHVSADAVLERSGVDLRRLAPRER
jgi:subtilisin family serine protease